MHFFGTYFRYVYISVPYDRKNSKNNLLVELRQELNQPNKQVDVWYVYKWSTAQYGMESRGIYRIEGVTHFCFA